jgi:glycerophosphoryl diester phosphodiesterase
VFTRIMNDAAVQPVIVAHRGASEHRAEHTLAAYGLALEQGAGGVECDVRLTRDGHLVCVHDRTVNRTSTGSGVVSELNLADLAALDYGAWHHELPDSADELVNEPVALPSSPLEHRGMLTLDALLSFVVDAAPDVTLFVETKHPVRYAGMVEERLVELLGRFGLAKPATKDESRVVVMSFSSRAVRRVRKYAPALPTVLLQTGSLRREGALPPWADLAGPGIGVLRGDPGYVERCRSHGHDVYCWTVDDPADVVLCERLGVRYLATNSPARTRAALGR